MKKSVYYAFAAFLLVVVIVIFCAVGSDWFTNGDIKTWFNGWGYSSSVDGNGGGNGTGNGNGQGTGGNNQGDNSGDTPDDNQGDNSDNNNGDNQGGNQGGNTPSEHQCQSVCIKCGGCLDETCKNTACADKCGCPKEPDVHTCESRCQTCGACLNEDCFEILCYSKCDCPKVPTPPEEGEHECKSVCPDCGGCLNASCKEILCGIKCNCETEPPTPEHICENKCVDCGGCLNSNCTETVCLEKCDCEKGTTTPVHICVSKCSKCGKCLNTDCTEEVCLIKCNCKPEPPAPVHKCETKCDTCGGCLNPSCKESNCYRKCGCEYDVCEHVCRFCNKCLDYSCPYLACVDKCDCSSEPSENHTCLRSCDKCGKCLDTNCWLSACYEKCDCTNDESDEEHTCQHVCPECNLCYDDYCFIGSCEDKCGCDRIGSGIATDIWLPVYCDCECCIGQSCLSPCIPSETGGCSCKKELVEDELNPCGCHCNECDCSETGVCTSDDCNCDCCYEAPITDYSEILKLGYLFDGNGSRLLSSEGAKIGVVFEAPQIRNSFDVAIKTHIDDCSPIVNFSILGNGYSKLFPIKRITYETTNLADISDWKLAESYQYRCAGSFKVKCPYDDVYDYGYMCLDGSCSQEHFYLVRVYTDYLLDLSKVANITTPNGSDYTPTIEFVRFTKAGEAEYYIHTNFEYCIAQLDYTDGDYFYQYVNRSDVLNPFGGYFKFPILMGSNWIGCDNSYEYNYYYSGEWYQAHFPWLSLNISLDYANYASCVEVKYPLGITPDYVAVYGDIQVLVYSFLGTDYDGKIFIDIYCPDCNYKVRITDKDTGFFPSACNSCGVPHVKYYLTEHGAVITLDEASCNWFLEYVLQIVVERQVN